MHQIILRKRDDRLGDKVPVYVGIKGKEESITITRGVPTEVSDAVFDCLMNSHEADYMSAISDRDVFKTEDTGETKRGPGRPPKTDNL